MPNPNHRFFVFFGIKRKEENRGNLGIFKHKNAESKRWFIFGKNWGSV